MKIKSGLELHRFIQTEYEKYQNKPSYVSFRYYLGFAIDREPIPFRFLKGGDLMIFNSIADEFVRVYGPFKTKKEAIDYVIT